MAGPVPVDGPEDLAASPDFGDITARTRNHDAWTRLSAPTANFEKYDLMHRLQAVGIASGPVLTGKDIHFDPQYQSRNFLERVSFPPERNIGVRPFMGRPCSKSPLKIRGPAPAYGQHNQPVLQELLESTRNLTKARDIVANAPL